ncbi:MAG: ATP-binding protein [Desulfobacteraceae bacterium]|nr:ATP-binding protein [Desulfobacteraceae bacterium]
MVALYGRRRLIEQLTDPLLAGQTLLLYGPVGSGKSAVLQALARGIQKKRRPCGFCRRTQALSDITGALLAVYPEVRVEGRTPRLVRSYLADAIEARPGVLLLDHLGEAGTQFKGYLRALRGTGLGVLLAADAEGPRDHQRVRGMHLSFQEIKVPPLSGRFLRRIMDDGIRAAPLPYPLGPADLAALILMAHGRPGWIIMAVQLLADTHYWRDGRVLKESLRAEIITRIARTYFTDLDGVRMQCLLEHPAAPDPIRESSERRSQ